MAKHMIHGKEYTTVAERVNNLHDIYKEQLSITTELISLVDGICVMKATIITDKGTFTGFALEREGSTNINKTSFLENCETSCIGRAASAAGFGGGEYASSNEVLLAIAQKNDKLTEGPVSVPTMASPVENGTDPQASSQEVQST